MTSGIKTLVALDTTVDRQTIEAALPGTAASIELVGIVEGLDEGWTTLQETATDLLVVACSGYSDRALFFIEGAVRQRPDRPVVVLSHSSPNGFLRRLFEVGADDVVTLPETPERVAFALQKVMARREGAAIASGVALAPMICVLGPKGGTGKTLTAANLAVSLASEGNKVVLVDLDLQFGDVGLSLGVAPEKTIYDLARSGGSLDADKLDAYLMTHPSGVKILMAPTRPDHASFVTVEFLREVYAVLRSTSDYVVVDTPPGFTPEVIASIDGSTHVVLVGMLDSLSLKNTKLGLETLELMGYDPGRICLLLNRADSRVGIQPADVEAVFGRSPDIFVPSDREVPRSITSGTPIVLAHERSETARAFRSLAQLYLDRPSMNGHLEPEQTAEPSLRRLFMRRR